MFTETWLDSDVPDSCISLPGYNIVRKDRNKYGGGIAIYLAVSLAFEILNVDSTCIPTLHLCESEILSVLFPALKIVLIAIYHPFWKDALRNEHAFSCISDIIEFVFTLPFFNPSSTKIIVCGDFNDLDSHVITLENSFGLHRKVFANTRGNRTLDHIFTNIRSDCEPSVSAPFGRSDHSVVMWNPGRTKAPSVIKKRIRNFSKTNRCKFETSVSLVNWNLIKKIVMLILR